MRTWARRNADFNSDIVRVVSIAAKGGGNEKQNIPPCHRATFLIDNDVTCAVYELATMESNPRFASYTRGMGMIFRL